ncbi:hypothetical protein M1M86_02010 [Dehalococcoidales bacterium]|nr:hypothetical protein [Dehalococcoidales bacterium]MCL0057944.1 hypothetical protein [Dehalococcoidales bacterium]
MAARLIPPMEVKPTLLDSILSSPYLSLNLAAWVPGLYRWQSIEQMLLTTFDGQRPIAFDIDTVELPTATRRWKISLPGYPEVTFDDLQAGKWPKPTEQEIEARHKALELARDVHQKLDIRPLTTSTIIRQLREGKVEDRD